MTGITWQNLIKSSEKQQTLNISQVGGCPGCDANMLTVVEELKTDNCQCSRKVLINFDNNTALCYDQIIPNLTNLIGRKKRLHHNTMFVHLKKLSEEKYKLNTELGASKDFYQCCSVFLIYGTGQ
eukprot:716574-Ditylum_brightwellii.AAC.1